MAALAWIDDARRDIPYALRALRASPAFAVSAILTLAFGIAATTTIFSLVYAILLRPLPYDRADRLVRVAEHVTVGGPEGARHLNRLTMTQREFVEWRTRTKTLSHLAVVSPNPAATLSADEGPIRVSIARVSPVLFEMLDARAAIGRTLNPDDQRADGNIAVLSAGAWKSLFASDPNAVGRTVTINRAPSVIVGVMPEGFQYPSRETQFWIPFVPRAGGENTTYGTVIARLADGVPLDAASAEANTIGAAVRPGGLTFGYGAGPPAPAGSVTAGRSRGPSDEAAPRARFECVREKTLVIGEIAPALRVLEAAVAAVLLIVCANIASLLLARAAAREREIGVRLAIGAGRGRIIRQILAESAVLGIAGGVTGAAFASGGVALVRTFSTADTPRFFQMSANLINGSILPRIDEVRVDGAVLTFALITSAIAGMVFGLAPALHLCRGRTIAAAFRSHAQTPPRLVLRNVLVTAQFAIATTLLVSAGLLAHSFAKLMTVDTGYTSADVVTLQLVFPEQMPAPRRLSLIESLLERARARPGVVNAGFTNILPFLALTEYGGLFVPPGKSPEEMLQDPLRPQARSISPGYLATLGVRLIDGRWLNEADAAGRPRVVLVNRALARRYFGDRNPVGVFVRMFPTPDTAESWQIVGVVDDVRQARLDEDPFPVVYMDPRQMFVRDAPGARPGNPFGVPSIAIRAERDAASVVADVRAIVREIEPAAGIDAVATLDSLRSGSVVRPRFYAVFVTLVAALAALLAAIGVYGVLAYSVAQRTPEIGIRMALGADRRRVIALVLRQGLTLAAVGITIGTIAALMSTRLLQAMLFGLTSRDPLTFAIVVVLFACIAVLASYLPARRASGVDPMVALRAE